jgi:hypothetical protein
VAVAASFLEHIARSNLSVLAVLAAILCKMEDFCSSLGGENSQEVPTSHTTDHSVRYRRSRGAQLLNDSPNLSQSLRRDQFFLVPL